MPQPEAVERLVTTLRVNGPLRGADLAGRLGVSKATLSRLVAAAGTAVRRYGSARATSYAAAGEVRGARVWPLYRIDSHARVVALGQLHALHHDHFFVELLQENPVLLHPPMQLGVFESLVNLWQAQWREVAVFALVILVLAFRPTGLFGRKLVEKV